MFNVPEGSYSTIPTLPENRIYELKKLIQTLHENGIKVISDEAAEEIRALLSDG